MTSTSAVQYQAPLGADEPAPARADELALARARRNRSRHDRLILQTLPIAYELAGRDSGPNGPGEEVVSVVQVGLVKAADSFELDSGGDFAAHAEAIIEEELAQHDRRRHDAPHGGRNLAGDAARQAIGEAIGRQPHVRELAGFLGCDVEDLVDGMLAAAARDSDLLARPTT